VPFELKAGLRAGHNTTPEVPKSSCWDLWIKETLNEIVVVMECAISLWAAENGTGVIARKVARNCLGARALAAQPKEARRR